MSNNRTTREPTPKPGPARTAATAGTTGTWRLAFIAYAVVLTVGTHWPALRLPPAVPTSDKTIHCLAFGILAIVIWRTRSIRPQWLAVVIALAWAVLDEVSQGIPALNRHVTWEDGAANVLGVVVVLAWIVALKPLGGSINRRRIAREQLAIDRLFGSPRTWYVGGGLLLACAAPVAIVWTLLDASIVSRIFLVATIAWAGATIITLRPAWRAARFGVARDRPCFTCGTPCSRISFDERGGAPCPTCGALVRFGQWSAGPAPTADVRVQVGLRAALTGVVVIVLAFVALLVAAEIRGRMVGSTTDVAAKVQRLISSLPPTLVTTVDLACLLLLMAACTLMYRRGLARHYDTREECRICGHDLRETPTVRGMGCCGECGTEFLKPDDTLRETAAES